MTTDRELDDRLAAAAGIRDAALPPLPDSFLRELRGEASAPEPASVLAARQLVLDARQDRAGGRRRRPVRRAVALLATAAVGVTALVVATSGDDVAAPDRTAGPSSTAPATPTGPPDDLGPLEAPPGGLALAATDAVSFPYSLSPEPEGLTPVLGYSGPLTLFGYTSPAVWSADYRSADDPGFRVLVSAGDPRILPPGATLDVAARTTESGVRVGGVDGDLVLGEYDDPSCRDAPTTPQQTEAPEEVCAGSYAQLTWQRPDGMWLQVVGEDDWGTAAAVVGVGESVVDRPQPVPLRLRLAPAGWSVSGYEDDTQVTVTDDADPTFDNRISVSLQERWRGTTAPDLDAYAQDEPVAEVTVNGRPAELVSVPSGSAESPAGARMWILEFVLPDGLVVFMDAPGALTREQVLQIAAQVVHAP